MQKILIVKYAELNTKKDNIGMFLRTLKENIMAKTKDLANIIEKLKKRLINKQTIFVGNSGVGKSSLANAIMGDDEIKTCHVSDKSKRGRHTTTTSKYYVWEENSSIIDTPGIRSLDISSFTPIEVQDYFPEFNLPDNAKTDARRKPLGGKVLSRLHPSFAKPVQTALIQLVCQLNQCWLKKSEQKTGQTPAFVSGTPPA